MATSENTTVMISKESAKKARIVAAHEDKTLKLVLEESIDQRLAKTRAVPAETKAELLK